MEEQASDCFSDISTIPNHDRLVLTGDPMKIASDFTFRIKLSVVQAECQIFPTAEILESRYRQILQQWKMVADVLQPLLVHLSFVLQSPKLILTIARQAVGPVQIVI